MRDAATSGPPLPGKRLLVYMLVIFAAAVIPAVFVPTLMCRTPDPQLDDLGVVPPFKLVDERGQVFTEDALRGHPTVVDFIFTRCDMICPAVTARMHEVQERTADAGRKLKIVSFSVDPAYDTPERLAAYAEANGADESRWRFVTGPAKDVTTLVTGSLWQSTKVERTHGAGIPEIGHGPHFLLIDADLHIRGTYDSRDTARIEALLRDARYLIRTSK